MGAFLLVAFCFSLLDSGGFGWFTCVVSKGELLMLFSAAI